MRFLATLFLTLATAAHAETVVFEPGLGDGKESFRAVAEKLDVPVFLNERPARLSTDDDGLRTGNETAAYLYAQLQSAGAKPPYYIVAHSIGSMTAMAFAAAHPHETGGVLLVDGRVPEFKPRCEQDGASPCEIPRALMMLMGAAEKAEIRGFEATDWPLAVEFGDTPLRMLISDQNPLGTSSNYGETWKLSAVEFSLNYGSQNMVVVPSGHYIHHAYPDYVVQQINEMLATH